MDLYGAIRPLKWYKILGTFPIIVKIDSRFVNVSSLNCIYLIRLVLFAIGTITLTYIILKTEIKESIITAIKIIKLLVTYRCLIKMYAHREMLAKFLNEIISMDEKLKEIFDIDVNYR